MAKSVKSSRELSPIIGYHLEYEEDLIDIKSCGMVFQHEKTGARICVISNEDDNKVFSVGFRTPPKDDTGAAHIVEHTVLCGSRNFPVKDPFIELAKGSLNTFLNAMTFPDKTIYPVASYNDCDFQNLMHVYMDAVFYPNIYQREEIFKQEGWHYELESTEAELHLNGIVYSEMKGAFSSPEQSLMRGIQHSLFPDTPYGTESGGDPDAIPSLTYQDFLAFHQKYYHPSNSYIYLYGDIDVEKMLDWLAEHYLNDFDYLEVDSEIPYQNGKTIETELTGYYSISSDEDERDNTYLSYNYVVGSALNAEECTAMQVLQTVLFDAPGAPVKQALIDAGIGQDILSNYENQVLQPYLSVVAKNSNPEEKERFVQVLTSTLKKLVKEGLREKSVLAAINSLEFQYREGDFGSYPKGLMHGINLLASWLYDDSCAFSYLHENEVFQKLREKQKEGYFEQLIQTCLLDSTHHTLFVYAPKKGLNSGKSEQLNLQLQQFKESLSEEKKADLVADTVKLAEYQETPSTPEELASIPLLSREDIRKTCTPLNNELRTEQETPVIYHDVFTNGIAYVRILFDLNGITQERLPYLGLLLATIGMTDTEHYAYADLSDEVNIHTGGMSINYTSYQKKNQPESYRPVIAVGVKLLYQEFKRMFDLCGEILTKSKFNNTKRLAELIAETKSRLQMKMNSSGHTVAIDRARSYFSQCGVVTEEIGGISFYRFIDRLSKEFERSAETVVNELAALVRDIFCSNNMTISLTCDETGYSKFREYLPDFKRLLFESGAFGLKIPQQKFLLNQKNEGFKYAGQVQYVACAGNYLEAGVKSNGATSVLRTILSYDYLWNNVRVKGGAYGCMCGLSSLNGNGFFVSYRDPNLKETLQVYEKCAEYVESFNSDERTMTKFIIGTFSSVDTPLTPKQKGERSLVAYLGDVTEEDIQKERDEILNCSQESIRAQSKLVKAIYNAGYLCVVGNETKLSENATLFSQVIPILPAQNNDERE